MIRFFKSTQTANLLIIPIILLIFWARTMFNANPVLDASDLPIWNLIASFLMHFPSWLNFIFLFTIVTSQVLYLNFMLNRHEVLYKNSFLPALIFTLFISSTPQLMQFHPVIIVNFIVIFILDRIFYLYKSNSNFSRLFDCGLLAGISALIYFPCIILLPMMLATLWVLRPFRLKEWLIVISVFLLPFFYASIYYFWNHTLQEFWITYMNHFGISNLSFEINRSLPLMLLSIFSVVIFLLSSSKLIFNYRKNTIRTRSYQQVFFIYFLFGFGWLLFSNRIQLIQFTFMIIPMVIFCSYYFLSAKRRMWAYESLLLIWIGLIVWNHLV